LASTINIFSKGLDMNEDSEKKPGLRKAYTGAGAAVGLALGVVLGTAFGVAMNVVAHVHYKNSKKISA